MAIARNPNRNPQAPQEGDGKAIAFIEGAEKARGRSKVATAKREPTIIRFDPALLEKVDAAAKNAGLSRSAWVQLTVREKLQ